MWPFRRDASSGRGGDTLPTLSERIDALERRFKMLDGEWSETLDRLNRLSGRLAKREERDGRGATHENAPGATNATPTLTGVALEVARRRQPREDA